MTTAILPPTTAQRNAAAALLAREGEWQYTMIDGVQTILMPSGSNPMRVYRVGLAGEFCDCHGSSYRQTCSHRLAAVRAGVRRQIIEEQHRAVLAQWVADLEGVPQGWSPISESERAIEAAFLARVKSEPAAPRRVERERELTNSVF